MSRSVDVLLAHCVVAAGTAVFEVVLAAHVAAAGATDCSEELAAVRAEAGVCRYFLTAVLAKILRFCALCRHYSVPRLSTM